MLSDAAKEKIRALKSKYPSTRSAIMPSLYVAQAEYGWLPRNALEEVAEELGMTTTEVGSVASFYTMYHLKPVGQHVVEFCTDLPCALAGADKAFERLSHSLGLEHGQETTSDNAITLRHAPCLGGCDKVPVLLVDNALQYEAMTDEKLDALVSKLRATQSHMNILGIYIDPVIVGFVILIIKCVVWIFALLTTFAYIQLVERWVIAKIQVRIGPNRTGPRGLLQPLADAIKALFKEELVPTNADKLVFVVAPMISVATALLAFAVVPVAPPIEAIQINGEPFQMQIANVNVALLYLLAVGSVSVYGTVLAGWDSNNKYSLLGSLRAAAQLISYEVTLGLALVGVLMITGSLNLNDIVSWQSNAVWLIVPEILGFILYIIAGIAETNRLPFDLPEAETELVAGYYTEYSSIKFAFFFMAEYINIITVCAIATTLFLGGYLSPVPFVPILGAPGIWWFAIKVFILIFMFMWIRGTFPRMRYDQLMNFTWKTMLPLALLNILITAGIVIYLLPNTAQALAHQGMAVEGHG